MLSFATRCHWRPCLVLVPPQAEVEREVAAGGPRVVEEQRVRAEVRAQARLADRVVDDVGAAVAGDHGIHRVVLDARIRRPHLEVAAGLVIVALALVVERVVAEREVVRTLPGRQEIVALEEQVLVVTLFRSAHAAEVRRPPVRAGLLRRRTVPSMISLDVPPEFSNENWREEYCASRNRLAFSVPE